MTQTLAELVEKAVDAWLAWLPSWKPPTHRGRTRICKRCTGSPIVQAAGLPAGVPHQVVHALVTRLHSVIDKEVDQYTEQFLPMLGAELQSVAIWKSGGYDAREGLPAETAGMDPDLLFEEGEHPVLFTFAELEQAAKPEALLPLPPLNDDEKRQLQQEIQLADAKATEVGQEVCFILLTLQSKIIGGITIFVEPQIQELLNELSRNLETPPV